MTRAFDESVLALNLSFVLHERSDSESVQSAIKAVRRHARTVHRFDTSITTATTTEYDDTEVTHWFTARIGLPHLLADAVGASSEQVICVDTESPSNQTIRFFRAAARVALPLHGTHRIAVAALILRPDRRTSHLAVAGIHDWPHNRDGAIRSLERLIQAHAGQWMPQRALWSAPAEVLLADEVN